MGEEWRECSDWLARINLIGEDHVLNTTFAKIHNLCKFLRDGVMLCKLLNIIDPDSIDLRSINQRPQNAQFLCMKNIGIFLQTCEKNFGLNKDNDLFEPHMLFEYSDFGRVLTTLSKLSKTPKALRRVEGFPKERAEKYNNEIYETLSKDMANHNVESAEAPTIASNGNLHYNGVDHPSQIFLPRRPANHEEAVYESLCYVTLQTKEVLTRTRATVAKIHKMKGSLQLTQTGAEGGNLNHGIDTFEADDDYHHEIYAELKLGPKQWMTEEGIYSEAYDDSIYSDPTGGEGEDVPRERRDLCLKEIVETEDNYVKALLMLCDKFLKPLKKVIPEDQLKIIFCKIPELAEIHKNLLDGLKEAQAQKSVAETIRMVARVFHDNQNKLLVYGEYCTNLTPAQHTLEDLITNNDKISTLIQDCQTEVSRGRHQLRDYLVVPLQRILKYHLLLKELINHTQSGPSDVEELRQAHEDMMDLADYINEVKRDNEMIQIIKDLQTSITDMPSELSSCEDLGQLRYDGETRIECHPDSPKKRYVFVFDKVLVICNRQARDEKYQYKDLVRLESCKVQNAAPGGNAKGKANSFYLVLDGNKKAYTIYAKDNDAKEKLMKNISQAIKYLNPEENQSLGHTFTITTFPWPNTRCSICSKLLKGTIFQSEEYSLDDNKAGCLDKVEGATAVSYSPSASTLSTIENPVHSSPPQNSGTHSSFRHSSSDSGFFGRIRNKLTSLQRTFSDPLTLNEQQKFNRKEGEGKEPYKFNEEKGKEKEGHIVDEEKEKGMAQGFDKKEKSRNSEKLSEKEEKVSSVENTAPEDRPLTCAEKIKFEEMESLKLREKSPLLQSESSINVSLTEWGDEWAKRLTDYQFLSGNDDSAYTQMSASVTKQKTIFNKSRRHTIIGRKTNKKAAASDNYDGYRCRKCNMTVHKDCVNRTSRCPIQPAEYPWLADRMTRREAEEHLSLAPEGTFLLRWSERHKKNILSLKALGEVKHMRVMQKEDNGYFYLSEARHFQSIVELINFYRQSFLSECFVGLDCTLRRPIFDTAVVKFTYEGTEPSQLPLVIGQRLTILSREGEARGWWKGRIGGRVGYFPKDYVAIENFFQKW